MKLFTAEQIRQADAYTIEHEPITSIDLMERAAHQCFNWIREKYLKKKSFAIFCGPGNNGGDGLAMARMLLNAGYTVKVIIPDIKLKTSSDYNKNLERINSKYFASIFTVKDVHSLSNIIVDEIIIDALFGSGLSRPLSGFFAEISHFINQLHHTVISIDIPSGVYAECNSDENLKTAIAANYTLTFQYKKISFFMPETDKYIGCVKVLPIGLHPRFEEKTETIYHQVEIKDIKSLIKRREKFSHKGTFGHGLLIAGSNGMFGAAVLAAKATIKSGIGLVTVHLPRMGYQIIQSTVPEALVSIDESDIIFTNPPLWDNYSAIAVGPALGKKPNTVKALRNLLTECTKPMVIDADALNIIAQNQQLLDLLPKNSILTPHPKEFDRLFCDSDNHFTRIQKAREKASEYNIIIVLKSAHTCTILPDKSCYINTTGNNGMATGGSGDVLTGIILSLLSQNYDVKSAALCGVFIHGLSGDIAAKKTGYHGLTASDLIKNLGKAFKKFEYDQTST